MIRYRRSPESIETALATANFAYKPNFALMSTADEDGENDGSVTTSPSSSFHGPIEEEDEEGEVGASTDPINLSRIEATGSPLGTAAEEALRSLTFGGPQRVPVRTPGRVRPSRPVSSGESRIAKRSLDNGVGAESAKVKRFAAVTPCDAVTVTPIRRSQRLDVASAKKSTGTPTATMFR